MRAIHTTILLALAGATACAAPSGPPEIVVDRSACAHCGMLISEPRFAGAYRLPGGEALMFDDLGCLSASLAEQAGADAGAIWVQDSAAGGWLEAESAWFVRSPEIASPMGSGIRALRDEQSARRLLARLTGGEVLEFESYRRRGAARVETTGVHR